jgi:hypothetical protein
LSGYRRIGALKEKGIREHDEDFQGVEGWPNLSPYVRIAGHTATRNRRYRILRLLGEGGMGARCMRRAEVKSSGLIRWNNLTAKPRHRTQCMCVPSRNPRTARELAEELIPDLEALANIHYLIAHFSEQTSRLKELQRTEEKIFDDLVQRVQKTLLQADDP